MHLQEKSGLKRKLPELIIRAYGYALRGVMRETGLLIRHFPENCP